ncbi:MAG: SDR family oxidoreductase, partial [Novosphingobium sp.]
AVDKVASSLESLAAEAPDGLTICVADLTKAEDVQRIFDTVIATYGRLDVLVNNAAIGGPRSLRLHEVPIEDFDMVMDVNLRSPLQMTKKALEIMRPQGGGAIVNLASPSGYNATPFVTSYSISKAGVVMLTKATAKEYASEGIRCNAVAPGVTQTPILDALSEEQLNSFAITIPQQRLAQPHEISEAVLFLASDRASYVNGTVLFVDGAGSS